MTTILITNAIASLLAGAAIVALLVERSRREHREERTFIPVYVTTNGTRRLRQHP